MIDFTQEVSRPTRILAIIGLSLCSLALVAVNLMIAIFLMLPGPANKKDPTPTGAIWGSILIIGVLTVASFWMLIRLLKGTKSANKVTMMPTWFITIFGFLFGCGLILVAVMGDGIPMAIEGIGISAAMIFIGRRVRKTQAEQNLDTPTIEKY
jgi:ABC-type transport system involved in multi-copper enzyme maturation permease subunit